MKDSLLRELTALLRRWMECLTNNSLISFQTLLRSPCFLLNPESPTGLMVWWKWVTIEILLNCPLRKKNPALVGNLRMVGSRQKTFFKRHNYKFEDISAVAFANHLGRQFLNLGLVTSTVITHFYACVIPAWFKIKIDLKEDVFLADILLAMKKERPGCRGAAAFPKWSLERLLKFLNSSVF